MAAAEVRLSRTEIERYHHDGYLAINTLTDEADLALLKRAYDRIFAERAGRERGDHFDLAGNDEEGEVAALPQILNPALYAPEILESQLLINATAVASLLLGEDVVCQFAHAILKPAHVGAETPWHQDAAYWSPDQLYQSISIWVPLENTSVENGCMQFVPRSHDYDVLVHQSINNDPTIHGLELASMEQDKVQDIVSCPLPGGGATVHGAYTLHHTPPNRSNSPRRALILTAGLPSSQRDEALKFPWMDNKQTARDKRAKSALENGMEVSSPPTG